MQYIGKFFTTIIIVVISTLYGGWVLSKLWNWLLVPIYGIKTISVIEAIATATVIGFFLLGATLNKKDDTETEEFIPYLVGRFLVIIITYSLYLLSGYILSTML